MKKLTIVTSLYKGKNYIESFLQNITNQTIWDQCELFILDANSPDGEFEYIKPYMEKYNNIRYERLDETVGVYQAWNYIIKNSNSEYLTNANVDDLLYPDFVEKHVEFLDSNNNIDVAYCFNIHTHYYELPKNREGEIWETGDFDLKAMLNCNLPQNHPVWRRSLHNKYGYFSEDYCSASDWEFWLRCATLGSKYKLIPEILGVYYRNPEGMSSNFFNMERNLSEIKSIRQKYIDILSFLCSSNNNS
jgi:glycosyltransferase involved in cell wall biosynthesis